VEWARRKMARARKSTPNQVTKRKKKKMIETAIGGRQSVAGGTGGGSHNATGLEKKKITQRERCRKSKITTRGSPTAERCQQEKGESQNKSEKAGEKREENRKSPGLAAGSGSRCWKVGKKRQGCSSRKHVAKKKKVPGRRTACKASGVKNKRGEKNERRNEKVRNVKKGKEKNGVQAAGLDRPPSKKGKNSRRRCSGRPKPLWGKEKKKDHRWKKEGGGRSGWGERDGAEVSLGKRL